MSLAVAKLQDVARSGFLNSLVSVNACPAMCIVYSTPSASSESRWQQTEPQKLAEAVLGVQDVSIVSCLEVMLNEHRDEVVEEEEEEDEIACAPAFGSEQLCQNKSCRVALAIPAVVGAAVGVSVGVAATTTKSAVLQRSSFLVLVLILTDTTQNDELQVAA